MNRLTNQKGQAVVELAIFGGLILFALGILLSYIQSLDGQQYAQMHAFRLALAKANGYRAGDGAGASAQVIRMENRRQVDVSPNFRKGSSARSGASSNIFWAVPKADSRAKIPNLITYSINENENTWNYRDFIDDAHDSTDDKGIERQKYWAFEPGADTTSDSRLAFNETYTKDENPDQITTVRSSQLSDNFHINIPYRIKEVDKDDENYEREVKKGKLWDLKQDLYWDDTSKQYKYKKDLPDEAKTVTRTRTWTTAF